QSADLPRLLAGYDVCLDDHSYMPAEVMAQCRGLKHIVFLGTGASSYMDVPALNGLGIKVHTIKGYGDIAVAEHTMALIFACCRAWTGRCGGACGTRSKACSSTARRSASSGSAASPGRWRGSPAASAWR